MCHSNRVPPGPAGRAAGAYCAVPGGGGYSHNGPNSVAGGHYIGDGHVTTPRGAANFAAQGMYGHPMSGFSYMAAQRHANFDNMFGAKNPYNPMGWGPNAGPAFGPYGPLPYPAAAAWFNPYAMWM